jgi:hyperosmotically inducible protein
MKRPISLSLALAIAAVLAAACHRAEPQSTARAPAARAPAAAAPAAATQPAAASHPAPDARNAPRDAISDSLITARIKAGILSDPGMTGSDVSVNTDRGVVSLTGIIKSQEQAAIASAHAQREDGVMRVDNQLAVNLQ